MFRVARLPTALLAFTLLAANSASAITAASIEKPASGLFGVLQARRDSMRSQARIASTKNRYCPTTARRTSLLPQGGQRGFLGIDWGHVFNVMRASTPDDWRDAARESVQGARDHSLGGKIFTDYLSPMGAGVESGVACSEGDRLQCGMVAVAIVTRKGGGPGSGSIWSATSVKSAVENAFGHWKKHASEFPELANAKQYVDAARSLAANPPAGALIKTRGTDTLIYDQASNTFLVKAADGAPRTMFRPTDGIDYWNKQ